MPDPVEQPLNPASVSPHRALMLMCLLTVAFVIYGLVIGWRTFIHERALRSVLQEYSENKDAAAKKSAAASGEMLNPAAPATPADNLPRVSLGDMAKQSGSDDGSESVVLKEPLSVTLPLDANSPDVQQADDTLQQYWRAADWKSKIAFVHNPDRMRAIMEDFYEKQLGADPEYGALLNRGRYRLDGTEILHFSYSCSRPGDILELALKRGPDGKFLLDWESYVGYSEMAWSALKKQRPTDPKLIRAFATVSDYYNYEFADKKKFLSVNLLSPDGLASIHGYCERESPIGIALTRTLSRSTSMTGIVLRIAYPEKAESDHCVLIKQFVSDRWLLLP